MWYPVGTITAALVVGLLAWYLIGRLIHHPHKEE